MRREITITIDYADSSHQLIISGFGPRTIIGAVEDLIQPDGSLSYHEQPVSLITIGSREVFPRVTSEER